MGAPEDRTREAEIQSAQARRLGTATEHMYAAELHHDAAAAWPAGSPERARHKEAENEHRKAWGRTPEASARIELHTGDADRAEQAARKVKPKQRAEAFRKAAAEHRSAAHVLGSAADFERQAEHLRRAAELEKGPPPPARKAEKQPTPPKQPTPKTAAQALEAARQAYQGASSYDEELRAGRAMDEARTQLRRLDAATPKADPRRVKVPGLGIAHVVERRRKPGRGPRERARLDAHHDAVDQRRAARALGRSKVEDACGEPVRAARELGAARLKRAREDRDAANATAARACKGTRERVRALPTSAERVAGRSDVRKVCGDLVSSVRDEGRARVDEARADRRRRVDRALENCSSTRKDVRKLLDAFMAENRRAEEKLYEALAAEWATPKRARSGKQIAAALAAKQRARSSRKRRAATVPELVELEYKEIPDDWHWLWKKLGPRFVRESRSVNAQPYELFFEHLKDHGISDPHTQGPMQSPTYAEEYERRIGRDVDRSEREQAVRETMEALDMSRDDAEAYVASWEKKRGKLASKPRKTTKRAAPVPDDDGIPF